MDIVMQNGFTSASWKIPNPGNSFYLGFAAAAVPDVNAMRDSDRLRYARKPMICTLISLNINGQWKERQLFPKLLEIVQKYRQHFDGICCLAG